MNENKKNSHKHLYPPEPRGPTNQSDRENINVETDHKEWPYGYYHPHKEEVLKKEPKVADATKPEQSKNKRSEK